MPAIVTKVYGTRCLNVKVVPKEPTWIWHVEQLRPTYLTEKDQDPGDKPGGGGAKTAATSPYNLHLEKDNATPLKLCTNNSSIMHNLKKETKSNVTKIFWFKLESYYF